jgi:hypothetical protein
MFCLPKSCNPLISKIQVQTKQPKTKKRPVQNEQGAFHIKGFKIIRLCQLFLLLLELQELQQPEFQ